MKREPIFGIYEKALHEGSFAKMMKDAKRAGYDSLELSIDCTDERLKRLDWGKEEVKELRDIALSNDMKILTMCLSGHKRFPLGSSSSEIREEGMRIMRKAIDLSVELGIRIIQLSGFDVYDREPETEETKKRYIDNIFESVKLAERNCVVLAIEPVEKNLLAVKDTMEVVKAIDSYCLQIYPDVANINSLGIDPVEELPYGKGHIAAIHMRESLPGIYDATLEFGKGYLDFDGVFKKLREMEYAGPFIVEMWNTDRPDYMDLITQARNYMREHMEKAGW